LLPVSAAAILALVVAGALILRSPSAASKASLAPLPALPRPDVVALPGNSASGRTPERPATVAAENSPGTDSPSARPPTDRTARSKPEKSTRPSAHPPGKAKRAPANAQNKHRLFEEL
jgi:hypothetical protein